MTSEPTPRTGPTEDHPATRCLQLRVRLDAPGPMGEAGPLHLVAELYERQGSKWTRLTCRTGPVNAEDALQGEGWTQAVKDLEWYRSLAP